MKLLVLAVVVVAAVLVPSLSEGRIVSKCELKNKLWKRIVVSRSFSSKDKEHLLAVVICELARESNLNTSKETILGERGSTTTLPTVDESEGETSASEEMLAEETTTEVSTTKDAGTTRATTTKAMTSKTTTTKPTKTKLQAGKKRPKREVILSNEAYEMKMELMVNPLSTNCDKQEILETEFKTSNEESDSNAEGDEENQKPWSLGSYGIFQLSDAYFCDSGHRLSKNKCKKSCSAFMDDDITDDIDCFMKIGCWKDIFQERSPQCSNVKNYFDGCK